MVDQTDQTAEHLDTSVLLDCLQTGWLYAKLLTLINNLEFDMEYRILIVEDDRSIAEAIAAHMAQWGLQAECVSDFRHIMEDFTRIQPHLVLMDISLPFMNGYHWCAEIRKVSSVPVIFISSASDNMNIIMAMNMGGRLHRQALRFRGADRQGAGVAAQNLRLRRLRPGAGASRRDAEHGRRHTDLAGTKGRADPQRSPNPPYPDAEQGHGRQSGEADGGVMADRCLRGRKHADCQRGTPAQQTGCRGIDGFHRHQVWRSLFGGVRA